MGNKDFRELGNRLGRFGIGPAAIYFAAFFLVTYPLMLDFSTHFFTDEKDGLVMIWNVWWTDHAVTQLHQSPWHTGLLYFPYGVSLLTHTLCPFNGFIAIGLLRFLTLVQTYNLIVVFTFVMTGLTTFWLSFYITRSYWPGIVAGFIFSFSNYHFVHTPGHLNLASLEWIPLFVLCWYVLLRKPGVRIAIGAAASLYAVLLCDYYYFFYCFLLALAMFLWRTLQKRKLLYFLDRSYVISISVFLLATLASSGVLIINLLRLRASTGLYGIHDPARLPADLLSPFIYGAGLRFSHLTKGFWMNLQGNTSESSVYMGLSVLVLLVYAWIRRKSVQGQSLRLWYLLILVFFAASLGPKLHVWGKHVPIPFMPYQLLETVFPLFKISGVPARLMIVVMLCAAVVSAMGLGLLFQKSRNTRIAAAILLVFMFVEFLPFTMKPFRGEIPQWVRVLKDLPGDGGVVDAGHDPYRAMYYQTVHNKPLWGGFVARIPVQLREKDQQIKKSVESYDFDRLHDVYGFRYVVSGVGQIYDLSQKKVIHRDQ
jgi:hypothetical protein